MSNRYAPVLMTAAMTLAFAAGGLAARDPAPDAKVLRVEWLEIIDGSGRVIASLGREGRRGDVALSLGSQVVLADHGPNRGASLNFGDGKGRDDNALSIGISEKGDVQVAALRGEKPRVGLSLDSAGLGCVLLTDESAAIAWAECDD